MAGDEPELKSDGRKEPQGPPREGWPWGEGWLDTNSAPGSHGSWTKAKAGNPS